MTKNANLMQFSKATLSIKTLFTSLDIHYSNRLNTEVQNQNELYVKKLQTKVFKSMIKRNIKFPKTWDQSATRKLLSIKIHCT